MRREGRLLERDAEFERAVNAVEVAREGGGRVIAVVGPAGIGKTELLSAIAELAGERGLTVLRARAAELERELPFGVARQAFELAVARAGDAERAALLTGAARLAAPIVDPQSAAAVPSGPDAPFSVFHGLYWLIANLADRSALALVVDDIHWADAASLGWLAYLSRRLRDLPLVLAVSFRPEEANTPLIDELLAEPGVEVLSLRGLSAAAVAILVRRALGCEPDDEFVCACHHATRGNPHLVRELAAVAEAEGIAPRSGNAARVLDLTPEAVQRAVLARTARVGPAAAAVARAVALLVPHAEPAQVAALAGLDQDAADEAVDGLARAEILTSDRPLEFIHPLVRTALYRDMGPAERARGHAEAARVLATAGAEPAAVAGQLLAAEPRGDDWAVERLREAAADSLARAAPSAAVGFLRRALAEPPPPELRAAVLEELGAAELRAGEPAAATHLREAMDLTSDPGGRARTALALAQAQFHAGAVDQVVSTCHAMIEQLGGADAELELELEGRAAAAIIVGPLSNQLRPRLRALEPRAAGAATPAERIVLALIAMDAAGTATRRAREVEDLVLRALGDGRLLAERGPDDPAYFYACSTLIWCGRYDLARAGFDAAAEEARRRGSAIGAGQALAFRAGASYMSGDVRAAESDARAAIDIIPPGSVVEGIVWGFLLHALIERGEADAAAEELGRSPLAGELPDVNPYHVARLARGRLRVERRELEAGLRDLLAVREMVAAIGFTNPGPMPWMTEAALVQAWLGRQDAAVALADRDLELAAGFAAPRGIGVALRVKALLDDGPERLELLRAAADALRASQDRLEHARALVDLGAESRRVGQLQNARENLRTGLAIARRCGATALVLRAYDELDASGVHQRRIVGTGVDALTASERRVAQMAAAGMTNAEVAQALFISARTVETHLRHAYQKLGIDSRAALSAALEDDDGPRGAAGQRASRARAM